MNKKGIVSSTEAAVSRQVMPPTSPLGLSLRSVLGLVLLGLLTSCGADLEVLGRDLLTVAPVEIKDIPVMRTMIGGKFVYTNSNPDPNQKIEYWYPTRGYRAVLDIPGG